MKKFLALLLVMMLIMTSFTACGSNNEEDVADTGVNSELNGDVQDESTEDQTEGEDEDKEGQETEDDADADADKEEESVNTEDKEASKQEENKPAKKEENKPADKKEEPVKNEEKEETEKKEESKPADDSSAVVGLAATPAAIIDQIYAKKAVELPLGTIEIDLADPDALLMFTGLSSADKISAAAASESMMGSQAYHVVLARAESADKAAELAQYLFDNADMARWVCVQATEKQAVVCGDLAFFVMLDPQYGVTCDQLVEGFTTVCGGAVDSVIK
jgi:flagellar biosynthesis GTPase FlhF